jgi:hypothetical protein
MKPDVMEILSQMSQAFEEDGFSCVIAPADTALDRPRLMVGCGTDDKGRDRTALIHLSTIDAATPPDDDADFAPDESDLASFLVHFTMVFPFALQLPEGEESKVLFDVLRLITSLNAAMELQGLGIDNASDRIYFRHALVTNTSSFNVDVAKRILGMVMMFSELSGDLIEGIVNQEESLDELILASA